MGKMREMGEMGEMEEIEDWSILRRAEVPR